MLMTTSAASLTPLVFQELMVFYSKFTHDTHKADAFFEKMLAQMKHDKNFRAENILDYVESLLARRESHRKIVDVFTRLNQLAATAEPIYTETDRPRFENRFWTMLVERVYANANSKQLEQLVEAVLESGLASRKPPRFANLVMAKHLETHKLDEAFDYYRKYLSTYRASLLEVNLLQAFLRKSAQRDGAKRSRLKDVLDTVSSTYDQMLAQNLIFYAHILNGDFKQAYFVFSKKLDFKFDLDLLDRLNVEFQSIPVLKSSSKHLRNIIKFNLTYGDNEKKTELDQKIREILK